MSLSTRLPQCASAIFLVALVAPCNRVLAQAPYIPPDFYGEKYLESIGFWENHGQVIDTEGNKPDDIVFYTTGSIPQLYLREESTVSFVLHNVDTIISTVDTAYHLEMRPWGAYAADVDPVGSGAKESYLNYFLPHCGGGGVTEVPGHNRVIYEDMFPYVDLHFYSGGYGQKMALVCRPGADLAHIELRFSGQDSLNEDLWGNLKFYHDGKWFVLPEAVAYQVTPGDTIVPIGWTAEYVPDEDAGTVTFDWESYDSTKALVLLIGPPPALAGPAYTEGVCWGTYLGGDGGDRAYASDTDEQGNYYVGGQTYSQAINFPIGLGEVYFEADPVAFVSRFGPGYEIHWSTFYGGSSGDQWVRGLVVREGTEPHVLIGGRTAANDLWCVDPQDGSYYDDTNTSGGGFLAELDVSGAAIWSTYFGNGGSVLNIDLHPTGLIAVCGQATGGLPLEQDQAPPTAEHWTYAGGGDAYCALLKPERRTYWVTFMGGSDRDVFRSVRFGEEKVVFAGESESSDFPLLDGGPDAHDESFAGGTIDVILSEFTLEGEWAWSTYLGGSGGDNIGYQGLVVRSADLGTEDIFLAGYTGSADLLMVPGAGWHEETFIPFTGLSGLIARFHGTDRSPLWITYVNAGSLNFGENWLEAICMDRADRVYVSGHTLTDNFPFQAAWQVYSTEVEYGAWDGVLMCFSNDQQLLWSTRFGGDDNNDGERIETITAFSDERFYAAGITHSSFNSQNFQPFTDPVGDTDYWDGVLYPVYDIFLAAFCIDGLLTDLAEDHADRTFSIVYMGSGQYELQGLPTERLLIRIHDATGRLVQEASELPGNGRVSIDLAGQAPGAYIAHVLGLGSVPLIHRR